MAKHTPGPWRFYLNNASTPDTHCVQVERVEHSDDHPVSIAYLQSYKHLEYDDRAETMANARLIAAAPDMLATLYELESYLEDREDVVYGEYGQPAPNKEMTLLREVREAIYKATGEKV